MKPWFQSGNSKIRKERAHVRGVTQVTKVANVGLGLPVVGRETAGLKCCLIFKLSERFLLLTSALHSYAGLQPRAVVYVRLCCLGRNARNVGPRCRPCGDAELAQPARLHREQHPGCRPPCTATHTSHFKDGADSARGKQK